MNTKGFTLMELLVSLVILGIVTAIAIAYMNYNYNSTLSKTEEIFVDTIHDALKLYLDGDAKNLNFPSGSVCTLNKTHGTVYLHKATETLTFDNVLSSSYVPLVSDELVNPANKDKSNYRCKSDGSLFIYRDDDYVYYYFIRKDSFRCLNDDAGYITNLPPSCIGL